MFTSTGKHTERVLHDPVAPTLIRMAIPMILGIIAVLLINIVDTFWVGRLGAEELTALSFTFPVSFTILSVLMGLGIGMSTAVSHAIGSNDHSEVQRLTSQGIVLAILIVCVLAIIGFYIQDSLFILMGAEKEIRTFITPYISVWFFGVALLAIPMIGNGAIRGLGDTTTPALVMTLSGIINAIFDPILIFGWGPIPAMGMQGAAVASIIAWTGSALLIIIILRNKLGILKISLCKPTRNFFAWKKILHVGAPAACSNLVSPIASGMITAIAANYGNAAVAGFGVGSRLEPLAMVVIMGLGSVLAPFIGQNWGAKQYMRAHKALKISLRFALLWMGAIFVFFFFGRFTVASVFSKEAEVISVITSYLSILPLSYGGYATMLIANSALNAIKRPLYGFAFSLIRLFILLVPLGYIGGKIGGITGMFIGMGISNIISGTIAWSQTRKIVNSAEKEAKEKIS